MSEAPTYRPFDQRRHLGEPPWPDSEARREWEAAHNHDVRTKCLVEYGCMAIEYERDALWAIANAVPALIEAADRRRLDEINYEEWIFYKEEAQLSLARLNAE